MSRSRWSLALLLLAASTGLATRPVHAALPFCNTDPPPPRTGFDPGTLVRAAQVVVVARAESLSRAGNLPGGGTWPVVHFAITEVIDPGTMHLPDTLTIPGSLVAHPDFNAGAVPYRWVRAASLRGLCYATSYQRGGEFVLLLQGATPDSLDPYWEALAPTNEQVRGRDDPWVSWVRRARQK